MRTDHQTARIKYALDYTLTAQPRPTSVTKKYASEYAAEPRVATEILVA